MTRGYEISVVNGDDFDMKGWFVANGEVGTPNCMGRFSRNMNISGGTGGSNDIPVIEHNHGASQVAHAHDVKAHQEYYGTSGSTKERLYNLAGWLGGLVSSETPMITVNNEGVSGVGLNKPLYIDSIPIIRMS